MIRRSPSSRVASALALLIVTAPAGAQLVFEAPALYPVSGSHGAPFAAGDLDLDGDVDVVVSGTGGFDVLLNEGDGTFAAALFVPGVTGRLELAHLDGDAFLDLVVPNGHVEVRFGIGEGAFGPPTTVFTTPGDLVRSVTVAEATGDAHLDLVVHSGDPDDSLANERADLVPGNGNGTFGAASPLVTGLFNSIPHQALVGDLDGDLVDDVVIVSEAFGGSSAHVLLGTGGGAYVYSDIFGTGLGARAQLRDVSGDGALDLLLTTVFSGFGVKLGNGDGTFAPATVYAPGVMVGGPVVADLDIDGHLDVVCRDHVTHELALLRGAGDGTFATSLRITGVGPESILDCAPAGVDFDGDGRTDFAMTQGGDAPVSFMVFRNHTYGPGDPFLDLGHALADDSGDKDAQPIFLADGTLVGGESVTLRVQPQGVSSQMAWFVKGLAPVFAPFKGGTMVPDVQFLTGPLPVPPTGLTFSGPMPLGVPPGTQFWMQFWFQPGGPGLPFSATSGIEATAP